MTPLLRQPGRIPSLFSERTEPDDAEPRRVTDRLAAGWTTCLAALVEDRADLAVAHGGSVLAGTGIALLVSGRPLLDAALVCVGFAASR